MSKRILAFVLTLSMLLSMVPVGASAANVIDSGSCGENLTYTLTDDGVLTISGTGDMQFNQYSQDPPWELRAGSITGVVIESGVTSIAEKAFYNGKNITSVTLPDTLVTIDDYAFYSCSSLKKVVIPGSVKTLGERAFAFAGINTIRVPEGVTEIPRRCFYSCNALHYVEIPASVTTIDTEAFDGCDELWGVYYYGTEEQWASFGNVHALGEATVIYVEPGNCSHMDWVNEDGYAAGCHTEGLTDAQYCPMCDTYLIPAETIPAAGHTFGGWVITKQPTTTEPGEQTRTCQVCGEVETEQMGILNNPFTDVKEGEFFYLPVLWAFSEGVTTGVTTTTFEPNATCTRAQVVTFLWRAAGSPEPTSTSCPFTDVEIGSWYSKAVLWAAENGITTGTSATTFAPTATILREQFVTFLWRAVTGGKPILTVDCPFGDVPEDAYYYDAVLWATMNGYCTGMGDDQFGPQGSCTRGQTVTFLYRYYAGTPVTAPSAIALSTRTLYRTDMAYGGSTNYTLNAQVLPVGGEDTAITWTSSDPSVATVSEDGTVSIVSGTGDAVITARCGNAVAHCRIVPPEADVTWFVDRSHHYLNNNLVVNSQTNPWAGTYMTSEGHLCVVTIIFAEVLTNGLFWDNRFITTVYDLTEDKTIRQPAEYYQKQADKAWGQEKIRYMEMVNEFLNIELNYTQLTEYYQKGLEMGLEGYWVPVGQ